jgi:hypothetical protein
MRGMIDFHASRNPDDPKNEDDKEFIIQCREHVKWRGYILYGFIGLVFLFNIPNLYNYIINNPIDFAKEAGIGIYLIGLFICFLGVALDKDMSLNYKIAGHFLVLFWPLILLIIPFISDKVVEKKDDTIETGTME